MLRSWPAETEAALSWPPKTPPSPRRATSAAAPEVTLGWAVGAGSRTVFRAVVSLGLISALSSGHFAERWCHVSHRRCAAEGTRCFSEAKGLLPLRTFVPPKWHLRGWKLRANEVRPDQNTRFRPWGIEGPPQSLCRPRPGGYCPVAFAPGPGPGPGPARLESWFLPRSDYCFTSGFYVLSLKLFNRRCLLIPFIK